MSQMDEINKNLERYEQKHVLKYWDELNTASQQKIMDQLSTIDFNQIEKFKQMLSNTTAEKEPVHMEPADIISLPKTIEEKKRFESAREIGENALRSGKVGIFLVAGGQGTRLGYDGPKGTYPIGPVTNKSIFQVHADKILAAGRAYEISIPWYIMTSQANHTQTESFFEDNNYFGLPGQDVFFIRQKMLPVFGLNGNPILSVVVKG